ncbi:hypothetical protein THF1C08_140121 [Vibrio jasicida]|nr:hypothetical protein THF1C08_140121 [Vibrio jasicida]
MQSYFLNLHYPLQKTNKLFLNYKTTRYQSLIPINLLKIGSSHENIIFFTNFTNQLFHSRGGGKQFV